MSKTLAALALAAAMTAGTAIPAAEAGKRGHHYHGNNHHKHHGHHHRGRGYYKDGKWIALGILGAAVGAAIADSRYRDCYYRNGRRYCD
jgi:hypothetical protein